jgi:predicted DCC family thiol-disulfide oxidoreductase YuxK
MQSLTIYYDGHCPLCLAEIVFLQSRNHQGLVRFVNFQENAFNEVVHQISCEKAMTTMHGRLEDGELLTGVRVFEEAYRRVGLRFLAGLLSLGPLRPVFDRAYIWFAMHRHGISRLVGRSLLAFAVRRYSGR